MDSKIWKKIPSFEGYEASNSGEIRSVNRAVKCRNGIIKNLKGKVLTPCISKDGYQRIALGSRYGMQTVHSLIALSFIKNTENKRTVNHKNGIRHDNRPENLEWATYQENIRHSFDCLGRVGSKAMLGRTGKDCPNSIPVFQRTVDGKLIKRFNSGQEAADAFGLAKTSISMAVCGKNKTAAGYKWSHE